MLEQVHPETSQPFVPANHGHAHGNRYARNGHSISDGHRNSRGHGHDHAADHSDTGSSRPMPSQTKVTPMDAVDPPDGNPEQMQGGARDKVNSKEDDEMDKAITSNTTILACEEPTDNDGMELEESVWDTALLIGLSHTRGRLLGNFQGFTSLVLAFLNCLLQAMVIYSVGSGMAKNPFEEGSGARVAVLTYRFQTAHKLNALNLRTSTTEVFEVCNGGVWNRVGNTFGDVDGYLTDTGLGFQEGPMVCCIAMFIWILSMTTEIRHALDTMLAIVYLPVHFSKDTCSITIDRKQDVYMVATLSFAQKSWCTFALCCRVAIAVLLLQFGLKFLADTLAVSDLILNACALEIVKSVDELLYEAIFSFEVRRIVQNTRIRTPPYKHNETREGAVILGWSVFTLLWFIFATVVYLIPFTADVDRIKTAICRGDTNFSYFDHPVTQLPYFASLNHEEGKDRGSVDELQCYYSSIFDMLHMRAGFHALHFQPESDLAGLIDGSSADCDFSPGNHSKYVCPEATIGDLQSMKAMDASEYLEDKMACRDQDVHYRVIQQTCSNATAFSFLPATQLFTKHKICADWAPHCSCAGCLYNDIEALPSQDRNDKISDCSENCERQGNFSKVIKNLSISWDWIKVIRRVCPRSCGKCEAEKVKKEPPGGAGMPGGAPPQQNQSQGGALGPTPPSGSNSNQSAAGAGAGAIPGPAPGPTPAPGLGAAGGSSNQSSGSGGAGGGGAAGPGAGGNSSNRPAGGGPGGGGGRRLEEDWRMLAQTRAKLHEERDIQLTALREELNRERSARLAMEARLARLEDILEGRVKRAATVAQRTWLALQRRAYFFFRPPWCHLQKLGETAPLNAGWLFSVHMYVNLVGGRVSDLSRLYDCA